jgi:hypothetical protein
MEASRAVTIGGLPVWLVEVLESIIVWCVWCRESEGQKISMKKGNTKNGRLAQGRGARAGAGCPSQVNA